MHLFITSDETFIHYHDPCCRYYCPYLTNVQIQSTWPRQCTKPLTELGAEDVVQPHPFLLGKYLQVTSSFLANTLLFTVFSICCFDQSHIKLLKIDRTVSVSPGRLFDKLLGFSARSFPFIFISFFPISIVLPNYTWLYLLAKCSFPPDPRTGWVPQDGWCRAGHLHPLASQDQP